MLECKSTSMVWKTADKTAPQKFKEKPFAGKVLATIIWDAKCFLPLEYCPQDSTVTSASYFDTWMCLQKAIKSKHTDLLRRKVILLHDKATSHSA